MADRLDAFARRLRGDPFFLASAMEDYARSEGLDGDGLAGALGCERRQLGPIGLCRRPHPDSPEFGHDVQRIAARFGIDEERLAEVVRRSDALTQLRQAGAASDLAAAARDRVLREESPSQDGGEDRS